MQREEYRRQVSSWVLVIVSRPTHDPKTDSESSFCHSANLTRIVYKTLCMYNRNIPIKKRSLDIENRDDEVVYCEKWYSMA